MKTIPCGNLSAYSYEHLSINPPPALHVQSQAKRSQFWYHIINSDIESIRMSIETQILASETQILTFKTQIQDPKIQILACKTLIQDLNTQILASKNQIMALILVS